MDKKKSFVIFLILHMMIILIEPRSFDRDNNQNEDYKNYYNNKTLDNSFYDRHNYHHQHQQQYRHHSHHQPHNSLNHHQHNPHKHHDPQHQQQHKQQQSKHTNKNVLVKSLPTTRLLATNNITFSNNNTNDNSYIRPLKLSLVNSNSNLNNRFNGHAIFNPNYHQISQTHHHRWSVVNTVTSTTTTTQPPPPSIERSFKPTFIGDSIDLNSWPRNSIATTFGSSSSSNNDVNQFFGSSQTLPPLPLPPITTMATSMAIPTKDRSFLTKQHHGRHVCQNPASNDPSLINTNDQNLYGNRYPQTTKLNCCPGWAQITETSPGCAKPICRYACKNGGKCIKPDICSCRSGFMGKYCELDVNECQVEKPCDQNCYNTFGSYYCTCRDGFLLGTDKQSCKKIKRFGEDDAFEARDLETDVDYEDLNDKITKIEQIIGNEKVFNNEIMKKMQYTSATMQNLKQRLDNVEHRQQELNYIKDKLNSQEMQSRKLEYIVDKLYKCRTKNPIYCSMQR